jgi:AcrR family transcriptional regulator
VKQDPNLLHPETFIGAASVTAWAPGHPNHDRHAQRPRTLRLDRHPEEIIVVMDTRPDATRPASAAKSRLLEVADQLFYSEGIHTVGIDRIIATAGVTKATFYKQYGSKDNLILDYVVGRSRGVRRMLMTVVDEGRSPADVLRWNVTTVLENMSRPGFRGCPFLNAAAEFPDRGHPVRQAIAEHREWYQDFLTEQLRLVGHPYPGDGADELYLLRDGAYSCAYSGDPVAAQTAYERGAERILAQAAAVVG